MKISPDGKQCQEGYRNPVDFGLNRDGELFVYDADMNTRSPLYRPTRVNQYQVESGDGRLPRSGAILRHGWLGGRPDRAVRPE